MNQDRYFALSSLALAQPTGGNRTKDNGRLVPLGRD
jgi:hypothetical protein